MIEKKPVNNRIIPSPIYDPPDLSASPTTKNINPKNAMSIPKAAQTSAQPLIFFSMF
jgi:hypothetical protein